MYIVMDSLGPVRIIWNAQQQLRIAVRPSHPQKPNSEKWGVLAYRKTLLMKLFRTYQCLCYDAANCFSLYNRLSFERSHIDFHLKKNSKNVISLQGFTVIFKLSFQGVTLLTFMVSTCSSGWEQSVWKDRRAVRDVWQWSCERLHDTTEGGQSCIASICWHLEQRRCAVRGGHSLPSRAAQTGMAVLSEDQVS